MRCGLWVTRLFKQTKSGRNGGNRSCSQKSGRYIAPAIHPDGSRPERRSQVGETGVSRAGRKPKRQAVLQIERQQSWRSSMTMRSVLLGAAAGLVTVGAAQAADLPMTKAEAVEYVKV